MTASTESPSSSASSTASVPDVWLPIPEFCERYAFRRSWAYEAHRLGRLPGAAKAGNLIRIHVPTFEAALRVCQ